ncbi:holliday junction resolvase [Gossypium australe]|uniref:Holliday junction resolvase n=1 Tax=Gossypium australe TaxID=47621 RepID=A0A5B6UPY7_9ROSI|nr:holliday junction resolvase [Gossypium australe]
MENSSSSTELRKLIEAIKISEVVEGRTELIAKLADLHLSEQSDVKSLAESLIVSSLLLSVYVEFSFELDLVVSFCCHVIVISLTREWTFWEDYTCLDVSQCLLNKTVLHVAAKYLDSDISGCLLQFLLLGSKASIWCRKHLKMTVMSTEESPEEEHCSLFYQLLLDFLSFSASSFSSMARYSVVTDKKSMEVVEEFIREQWNLIKGTISEIKSIDSVGSEVLKAAQAVIDAVIRLCKEYYQVINWEFSGTELEKNENDMECEQACIMNNVMNITTVTVEKLFELGILAANDGGSLVTILNVSWKGLVNLLQLSKGKLPLKVKVADIVVTLISLVNGSLKCAAESWLSPKETISVTEARRIFVPIKFYLINAVKISSLYPCQGYTVYRDLALCVLMISTFKLSVSNEKLMKNVSEVMAELLEKTSLDLLSSLLNSSDVKQEHKYELVDWLFFDDCWSDAVKENQVSKCRLTSLDEIFSVSCETLPKSSVLVLGQVATFSSFLRYPNDLEDDVKLMIARKLDWFLNSIIDEKVYSSILVSQIPLLYVSGKNVELTWEPMFSALLQALKTFMIVVSSTLAWEEFGSFLVKNFLHPHFLCSEIIMELWCFLVRHAELELVNGIIVELFALMKLVSSPELVFVQDSSLRKMAKSVCLLLSFCSTSVVECVYCSVIGDDRSQLSSILYSALLLEGFPLNLLSKNMRSIAKEKIISDYFGFIDSFDDKSLTVSSSEFALPVFALSASLLSLQVTVSDMDMKTLKFLVNIICGYRNSVDKLKKKICCKLLSQTLGIISSLRHLYESAEMEEVILELHNLFVSGPAASDTLLNQCKPGLTLFLAGLSNTLMSESDTCPKSTAVWELYHMVLRERHWAFVHLSIAAFGYFAARTSCNQLWRFMPQDAALSYDLVYGTDASEDRFMSEFKAFLEKERALPAVITTSIEQQRLLLEEGLVLKQMVRKILNINSDAARCDKIEIDDENQSNKRRKLPDGINKGVELLQDGLKVINDSLTQWQPNHPDSAELHERFMTHFSMLENVISHLQVLSGSG